MQGPHQAWRYTPVICLQHFTVLHGTDAQCVGHIRHFNNNESEYGVHLHSVDA